MPLTDAQRELADAHVGEVVRSAPLTGKCVAWFEGQDSALLVVQGDDGPFTVRVPLAPDEEELARRGAEQSVMDKEAHAAAEVVEAERLAAIGQVQREEFRKQLAEFVGVDPDNDKAMEAVRVQLAAAAVAAQSTPG